MLWLLVHNISIMQPNRSSMHHDSTDRRDNRIFIPCSRQFRQCMIYGVDSASWNNLTSRLQTLSWCAIRLVSQKTRSRPSGSPVLGCYHSNRRKVNKPYSAAAPIRVIWGGAERSSACVCVCVRQRQYPFKYKNASQSIIPPGCYLPCHQQHLTTPFYIRHMSSYSNPAANSEISTA
jgi:hypothetical protein